MDIQACKKAISQYFGFKEELIQNVHICGLWHVRFTVNHICYYACVSHAGAEPMINVVGNEYKYFDHACPVTEEYYNEFIAGKRLHVRKCVDSDAGDWIYTGDVFDSLDEYLSFVEGKSESFYDYEYAD